MQASNRFQMYHKLQNKNYCSININENVFLVFMMKILNPKKQNDITTMHLN